MSATENIFYTLPDGREIVTIHVPKSGGCALRSQLFDQKPTYYHLTWKQIEERYGGRARKAIKVAIIRSPRDRFLSVLACIIQESLGFYTPRRAFEQTCICTSVNGFQDRMSLLAHQYLESCPIDFVIRQETMQSDTDRLCDTIGLKKMLIKPMNVTTIKLLWDELDSDLRDSISHFIAADFEFCRQFYQEDHIAPMTAQVSGTDTEFSQISALQHKCTELEQRLLESMQECMKQKKYIEQLCRTTMEDGKSLTVCHDLPKCYKCDDILTVGKVICDYCEQFVDKNSKVQLEVIKIMNAQPAVVIAIGGVRFTQKSEWVRIV